MSEIIWRFDIPRLDDESVVHPIFAALAALDGFEPVDYDLNRMEQWRDFSVERVVVDALTQRTQLVRVRAKDEASGLAMIAMGKHDEQPTAIIRLPEPAKSSESIRAWRHLFDDLPLGSAVVSDHRWRRALSRGDISEDVIDGISGMVLGWKRGREPAAIGTIDDELSGQTSVEVLREGAFVALKLAETPELDGDAHIHDIERAVRLLRRT
ncbi:MAG: hypothetical protein ACQEVA_02060 [Myxococcota bacterium]